MPAVAAAAVLVVGAVVFLQVIPIHHVEQSRLSRLTVPKAPAGFNAKPTSAAVIPASSVSFSAFKTAAKRSPNQSGSYGIQWAGTTSPSTNVASVLVSWLPTTSDAAAVQKEAVSSELSAGSMKAADNYALERRFNVAAVPGAQAAVFGPSASKGSQGLAVVVFREGRYVVTDFVQMTTAAKAQAEAISLTEGEDSHLQLVRQDFTLSATHWPLGASVILAGVTVALAALLVLVPIGVSRGRRRQVLAREAASRRAVQGRGRKIARHQAARSR
jgi:hypothetical protein